MNVSEGGGEIRRLIDVFMNDPIAKFPHPQPAVCGIELYKVVAEHLEGWLENRAVAEQPVSAQVEGELRSYLTRGILCLGFARARCTSCGQGFVVAFSWKDRGVCPSCNGRRMAQTAAHLVDRVIPPVPVRQWVQKMTLSTVCKRQS